jgi:hypothetical protein
MAVAVCVLYHNVCLFLLSVFVLYLLCRNSALTSFLCRVRLKRWDFETEEEWAKYSQQIEATPKAAFQFMVKKQDGRKTRKDSGKKQQRKLDNELKRILKVRVRVQI